jgi:hypothetical protein
MESPGVQVVEFDGISYLVNGLGQAFVHKLDSPSLNHVLFRRIAIVNGHRSELHGIGVKSLKGCRLTSALIPKTVAFLGRMCFCSCSYLDFTPFEFESTLNVIGESSFVHSKIQAILIPRTVESIKESAFSCCSNLDNVFFESNSSLVRIEKAAFSYSVLRSISIPSSVEFIGKNCFASCLKLGTIQFGEVSELRRIERCAFSNSALQAIVIPAKVAHLGEFIFLDCDRLRSIRFEPHSQLRTLTQPFLPSPQRASICLPSSLEQIDGSCLIDFKSVSIEPGNPNLMIERNFLMDRRGIIRYLGHNSIVRVPVAVEVLGPGSFSYCAALTQIIFDKGTRIREIQCESLSYCSLRSIVIPATVRLLGRSCFSNCKALEALRFEANSCLRTIEDFAFWLSSLASVRLPKFVEFVAGSAFARSPIGNISLEDGCLQFKIDRQFLLDRDGARLIRYFGNEPYPIIHKNIEFVSESSFSYATIDAIAFANNSRLRIFDNDAVAFSTIKSVIFPRCVEVIGKHSFGDCKQLQSVTFVPESKLKRIEEDAFSRTSIRSICLPKFVDFLGVRSFAKCYLLNSMCFEAESCLTELRFPIFALRAPKSFTIPKSLESVNGAFFTDFDESAIAIPSDNHVFILENHFLVNQKTAEIVRNLGQENHIVIPRNMQILGPGSFACLKYWITLSFEAESCLKRIGERAFEKAEISSIEIPSSVEVIERFAFACSVSLGEVTFACNSSLKQICEFAFWKTGLQRVVLPDSLEIIEHDAFDNTVLVARRHFHRRRFSDG